MSYGFTSNMPNSNGTTSLLLPALKGFTVLTPLFMAGGMSMTSLQVIPALIALTRQTADSDRRRAGGKDSGRLTPQPHSESHGSSLLVPGQGTSPTPSTSTNVGYEVAARQFVALSQSQTQPASTRQNPTTTSLAAVAAPGLLTVLSASYLAHHARTHPLRSLAAAAANSSPSTWRTWAAVATLMAVVVPLTAGVMGPIEHKIARVAGVEDEIEPYEDSPLDREIESANVETWLRTWNSWNSLRAAVALTAGALGLWAQIDRV